MMYIFKRFVIWMAVTSLAIFLTISFSKTAHAGLISFMASILGSPASASVIPSQVDSNSQTMAVLTPANNLDPSPEKAVEIVPVEQGDTLNADIASANATSTDNSTDISAYTVRDGDTIGSVAKMFDVSVNTILWANSLTSTSVLKTGQTLIILPISGITYTLKSGDTIRGIARKYGADVNDILSYNDMTLTTRLVVGQTIIIPDAETAAISQASRPRSTSNSSKTLKEPLLDNISRLPSYPGYYERPIAGGIVSQGLHGHNAIDLASPVGTPIVAAAPGTVIIDIMNGAWNGGYGNYVVISHPNGTQTLYAHMQRGIVSVGQTVTRGQPIGYIGMTGHTTGPHVHFEVRGARNPF